VALDQNQRIPASRTLISTGAPSFNKIPERTP
jgi:hypothetical protein